MGHTREKSKGRRETGRFVALPHIVMDHEDFSSLSRCGLKVLMCLLRQYNGRNNGNLSATLTMVKASGIGSSASLVKALIELQEKRLIVRTREGRFMKPGGRCALYGITWKAIDECPGKDLEHMPTSAPLRSFSLEKSRTPASKSEQGSVQKLKRQQEETT